MGKEYIVDDRLNEGRFLLAGQILLPLGSIWHMG